MSGTANALDGVVDLLIDYLAPLQESAVSGNLDLFLAQHNWIVADIDPAEVGDAVATIIDTLAGLDMSKLDSIAELTPTLESLGRAGQSIARTANVIAEAIPGTSTTAMAGLIGPLAADVLDALAVSLIERKSIRALRVLQILGIIADTVPDALSSGGQAPLIRRVALPRTSLNLDALRLLLSDPGAHIRARLGFGTAVDQASAEAIVRSTFTPLARLADELGAHTVVGLNYPPVTEGELRQARSAAFLFTLPSTDFDPALTSWFGLNAEVRPPGAGPAGLALTAEGGLAYTRDLDGVQLALSMAGSPGEVLFPTGGGAPVLAANDSTGVEVSLGFTRPVRPDSALILGSATGGLVIEGLHAQGRVRFGRSGAESLDVSFSAALDKATFIIKPAPGDGFLSKVLPADGLTMDLALGLEWSNTQGLRFSGAGSMEADLFIHLDLLGVLKIEVVHLSLGFNAEGLTIALAADIDIRLGPIAATIQGMGLKAALAPVRRGESGNLGPLDLAVQLVPPKGVGLVIDAAAVKGAGFVLNDPAKGRYAGALQLRIADVVSVTAIGLVSTKLPDGSAGFSMVVIITATFAPIQLGFGFSLSGLGGLVGINRTMDLPALRDKVRTGALDSILFPLDPVARIGEVLSDIESVFPSAQGRFTAGIMARLGWGSPQLVSVDLGLIISLPAPLRIALIGRVIAVLPNAKAPVVILQIDIAGGLDLGRNELWIEASLHDSRVALFDISGGLAIRSAWGDNPTFVISVGGFNPHFTPPPDFNPPARLTIALAAGKNPRVRLEAYLAITSNTLQAGAHLEAHAEVEVLGIWSADLFAGFDALVTREPFGYIVDFCGGVQIKHNGEPFIGASFLLSLSGPQPLRALGYAEVNFFGTHRIPIDVDIGAAIEQAERAVADLVGLLRAAIEEPNSWSALPPADAPAVATQAASGAGLFAHPLGALAFRQCVVPLEVAIERFGGLPLPDGTAMYTLAYAFGAVPAPQRVRVRDAWAPGDLFTLTDEEKLSLPSFSQLISGDRHIGVGADSHGTEFALDDDDLYETSIIDASEWRPIQVAAPYQMAAAAGQFLHRGAVQRQQERNGLAAPDLAVTLAEPRFAVASTATMAEAMVAVASTATMASAGLHPSWVEARQAARAAPGMQVVDSHEVSA